MAEQTEWVERIDQFVSGTVHEQVRGLVQQMHEGFAQIAEALSEQTAAVATVRRDMASLASHSLQGGETADGEPSVSLDALREAVATELRELVASLKDELLDDARSSLTELAGVRGEIATLVSTQGEVAEQVRRAVQDSTEQIASALRTEVRASVDRFASGREEALSEVRAAEQRTVEGVGKHVDALQEGIVTSTRAQAEDLAKHVDGISTALSRVEEGREELGRSIDGIRDELSKQLAKSLKESSGTTALAIGDVRAALVRQAETLHLELMKDLRESVIAGQQETLKGLKEVAGGQQETLKALNEIAGGQQEALKALTETSASLARQAETLHQQILKDVGESLATRQQETLKALREASGTLALAIGDVRASLVRQGETFQDQTLTEIQTRFTGLLEEVRDQVLSESKRVQRHLAELVAAMKKEGRRPVDVKADAPPSPQTGAFEFATKPASSREAKPTARSSKPTNGNKEKGKTGEGA